MMNIIYTEKNISPDARMLIKNNHYSKSYRSLMQKHVFELHSNNELIGVAVFGRPIGRNLPDGLIELRRLVLIDDKPKNTTSWFLARCIKWLKKNTDYNGIITYADPNEGHTGVIYRACNFTYLGRSLEPNPRIITDGKKKIHLRQVYQKRRGVYSVSAKLIQKKIKEGKFKFKKVEPKHRFYYPLKKFDIFNKVAYNIARNEINLVHSKKRDMILLGGIK